MEVQVDVDVDLNYDLETFRLPIVDAKRKESESRNLTKKCLSSEKKRHLQSSVVFLFLHRQAFTAIPTLKPPVPPFCCAMIQWWPKVLQAPGLLAQHAA